MSERGRQREGERERKRAKAKRESVCVCGHITKTLVYVFVRVPIKHSNTHTRRSCQLCLVSLATSLECCQGCNEHAPSDRQTDRRTGSWLWARATKLLTTTLHARVGVCVLSHLSCLLKVR